MIDVRYHGAVAVVKLNRDVTNALNQEVVRELSESLERLRVSTEVRAIVMTSANEKFFSIGLDIPQLYELPEEAFREFYKDFNRTCLVLYTLPKPTVAGITGHAIAGGCILSLCCDYRVIAEGRKLMGLNEIKLGVPVPYPADCILQSIAGEKEARKVMDSGEFYESEILLKKGMVDEVVPLEAVISRAMEKAEALSSILPETYRKEKRTRIELVETRIRENLEEKERKFLELWHSDEARRRLRKAMDKF